MPSSYAPLFLLALPFIEIAGFIIVGSHVGVLATIGLLILSAILGFFLLRIQGFSLLQRIRSETAAGRVPDREVVHGAMLVMAAILLIVPGFFTSAIGLLLFMPPIRDFVWNRFLRGKMVVAGAYTNSGNYSNNNSYNSNSSYSDDNIIDLDPEDFSSKPDPNSPWRPNNQDK
ncbi:FxsA family protein [Paenochrobactrum glaciei]|uniref:Membrane protein FxsA n=1 Tax=Paenochrobactrum glaciei TaxID=486407 RepID=A0ABP3QV70_9HYPH